MLHKRERGERKDSLRQWESSYFTVLWFGKNKSIKQMTIWKGETQPRIMTHCKYNKKFTQINFQKVFKKFSKVIKR